MGCAMEHPMAFAYVSLRMVDVREKGAYGSRKKHEIYCIDVKPGANKAVK